MRQFSSYGPLDMETKIGLAPKTCQKRWHIFGREISKWITNIRKNLRIFIMIF
jgi:hypothetical protein